MSGEGYETIKIGDQDQLRRFMRRISERLDALEGRSGTTVRFSNLDMNGHGILGGPADQSSAIDTDFITKKYLNSVEASRIIQANLKAGGTAPVPTAVAAFAFSAGRIDTFANRGTASTHIKEWFFASDRNYVSWLSNGANWLYVSGTQSGTTAVRPTLTVNDNGYLYHATDTDIIYLWNGSAWVYYIPDADTTHRGLISTGSQTVTGDKSAAGTIRSISTANPSSGAGTELRYVTGGSPYGQVLSFDRTAVAWKPLRLDGSAIAIGFASGGNTGLGIDSPIAKLHVVPSSGYGIAIRLQSSVGGPATTVAMHAVSDDSSLWRDLAIDGQSLIINSATAGSVGIGTAAPAAKLAINGGVHVGGDSDPGDNNLAVDGTVTIPLMSSAGFVKNTAGGLLSGGNSIASSDLAALFKPSVVSSQFDKTNDSTLANVTGLTATLVESTTYKFKAVLFVDADVSGGQKYAISGTCNPSAIIYQINTTYNTGILTVITSRQTALGGSAGVAGPTVCYTQIEGTVTVAAGGGGTLTVQFAQNVATPATTSSVLVGSTFTVDKI